MSDIRVPKVSYYYKPTSGYSPAEVVEVFNCTSLYIQVPTQEFDLQLNLFFQRDMTAEEKEEFGRKQTWRIFTCWGKLEQTHSEAGVSKEIIENLQCCKNDFTLSERVAA
ncbi:hypothetical protein [Pontibacter harenae]|uniref:hypothetical protein n=1 Tax=Pontibacter harenae TaxID=2894083 RepID=UPI001E3A6D1B|nr:hypothetical protein [Pontibacter harenae]MCC9168485.1 hypothetical protein [Pontibacter harenae]